MMYLRWSFALAVWAYIGGRLMPFELQQILLFDGPLNALAAMAQRLGI